MPITMRQAKNRIISICDTTDNFVEAQDNDAFTNLINDTQYELFRTLYTVYGEDMAQEQIDLIVQPGDGYYPFTSLVEAGYYYYYPTVSFMPFAIFRIDHLIGSVRIPMKRFSIANERLDITPKSWQGCVKYDWRPGKIWFNPINAEEQTFRMYYVPKPTVLVQDLEYVHWITEEHIELFTILGAMKVFAKSETPTTELQRQYDLYINRIKSMLPRDHGQVKHIQDVQENHYGEHPYNDNYLSYLGY